MTSVRPPISSETDSGTDTPSSCSCSVRLLFRKRGRVRRKETGGPRVGGPPAWWTYRREARDLAAQAEIGDELAVALDVLAGEVGEQAPALTDLHEQAAAAVMVLLVDLQVLGELVDRGRQNRDLDVGGPGVVRAAA